MGMLMDQFFDRYQVGIGKIFFRLYENLTMKRVIESHYGDKELLEIREKSGVHPVYCDHTIPIHFHRYLKGKLHIDYDVMREEDVKPKSKLDIIKSRLKQAVLTNRSDLIPKKRQPALS